MDAKVETILAELRLRLKEIYGDRLMRLVLYGSQARGDAEDGSDIDVLVVLAGPINHWEEIQRTSEIRIALLDKYEMLVSCVYVSDDRYAQEKSPLLINVRREGLSL